MLYVYPVTHSTYPTFFVEQIRDTPAERTAEIARQQALTQSERPYEPWDDARGRNVDILV